jgi:hypothetical protein
MPTEPQTSPSADEVFTAKQAADHLKFTPDYLERLRSTGKGPPYLKIGNARTSPVRYRRSDVDAWLDQHERTSTFDDGSQGAGQDGRS